jgi:hypothetical protein
MCKTIQLTGISMVTIIIIIITIESWNTNRGLRCVNYSVDRHKYSLLLLLLIQGVPTGLLEVYKVQLTGMSVVY